MTTKAVRRAEAQVVRWALAYIGPDDEAMARRYLRSKNRLNVALGRVYLTRLAATSKRRAKRAGQKRSGR